MTLPTGYRPAQEYLMIAMVASGGVHAFGRVDVSPAGVVSVVYPATTNWVSLDQITFKAQ
jgi:hypothetical protein